jgi:hypothetical protein
MAHEKLSHKHVAYENKSQHTGEFCANCSMFVSDRPPHCTLVKDPILARGWCKRWDAKK